MSYKCYLSLHVEQKEVSQKMTSLSNRIQLGQRGMSTLRKTLNEVESQISDLDTAKEIAKKGNQCERKVKIEWRKNSLNGKKTEESQCHSFHTCSGKTSPVPGAGKDVTAQKRGKR